MEDQEKETLVKKFWEALVKKKFVFYAEKSFYKKRNGDLDSSIKNIVGKNGLINGNPLQDFIPEAFKDKEKKLPKPNFTSEIELRKVLDFFDIEGRRDAYVCYSGEVMWLRFVYLGSPKLKLIIVIEHYSEREIEELRKINLKRVKNSDPIQAVIINKSLNSVRSF